MMKQRLHPLVLKGGDERGNLATDGMKGVTHMGEMHGTVRELQRTAKGQPHGCTSHINVLHHAPCLHLCLPLLRLRSHLLQVSMLQQAACATAGCLMLQNAPPSLNWL